MLVQWAKVSTQVPLGFDGKRVLFPEDWISQLSFRFGVGFHSQTTPRCATSRALSGPRFQLTARLEGKTCSQVILLLLAQILQLHIAFNHCPHANSEVFDPSFSILDEGAKARAVRIGKVSSVNDVEHWERGIGS